MSSFVHEHARALASTLWKCAMVVHTVSVTLTGERENQ